MMERGDDTASAACTSILYRVCYAPPPSPNEHTSEPREGETIEGSHIMRNRPYPVLKRGMWMRVATVEHVPAVRGCWRVWTVS